MQAQIKMPSRYHNLINRVNVFQLLGDAEKPEQTMKYNVARLLLFYNDANPMMTNAERALLHSLLVKFYRTANFYHVPLYAQHSFFIVNDFNKVDNSDWLTITQFINFLKFTQAKVMRSPYEMFCDVDMIHNLFTMSRMIQQGYYYRHQHTLVSKHAFNQIIHMDFPKARLLKWI